MDDLLIIRNGIAESLHTTYEVGDDIFSIKINDAQLAFPLVDASFSADNGIMSPKEWLLMEHKNNMVHEPGLVSWIFALSSFIKQRKVRFIDVGALYGYFSLLAEKVFANCEVIAIEANPRSAEYIASMIKMYTGSRITISNCFVSDRAREKQKRYVVGYHFISGDTFFGPLNLIKLKNLIKKILMHCGIGRFSLCHPELIEIDEIRLSSLLSRDPNVINILKIDAEGYQATFLPASSQDIIATDTILLLEFDSKSDLAKFDSSNEILCRPFLENGYELFWCDHRALGEPALSKNSVDSAMERNSLGVLMPKSFKLA